MSIRRLRAAWCGVVFVVAMCLLPAAPAAAAGQVWNGPYTMVTYASKKAGTSAAASQPEQDFSARFVLTTSCATGRCVATAAGPGSSNPTVPQPQRFVWNGENWTFSYDWQWECNRGEGVPRVYSPASSWIFYTPQPDGTLTGTWYTDILSGPCRGNVIMPVGAFPAV